MSSTPYLLAYTLPLLLISLLLTFSGTFLTLDRSRIFPLADKGTGRSYTAIAAPGAFTSFDGKKRKFSWVLDGGLGGLAGGYVFGIHLSTALSLMIPGTTSSAPLSSKSFLAVWVLSCAVTTPLAGRYRHVAFLFLGVSGGTLTALALCIITHPSLPSRIVLVGIFLPLFTLLLLLASILPISRLTNALLHPLMRLCTASTGAFGLIMAIALLMQPKEEGWANAWERLWMNDGPVNADGRVEWGSTKEQGLSAGYAVFLFSGVVSDWALRRWIGECPDEKWDSYLANYTANLPDAACRAGSFEPYKSFIDRLFMSRGAKDEKDILFPNEIDMKVAFTPTRNSPLPLPVNMGNISPKPRGIELTRVPTSTELLKKKRSKKSRGWKIAEGLERKPRKPVKFGDVSDSSDDAEDDKKLSVSSSSPSLDSPLFRHDGPKVRDSAKPPKPVQGHSYTSSSTPTLVDGMTSNRDGKKKDNPKEREAQFDTLDPLDYDEEIAQLKARLRQSRSHRQNSDEFDLDYSDYEEDLTAQRGLLRAALGKSDDQEHQNKNWSPAFLKRHDTRNQSTPINQPTPVPATPSLIRALDRLAQAHNEAYGSKAEPSPLRSQEGPPAMEETGRGKNPRSRRWEEFWREVHVKARS
ncbi:hypothetical protein BDN70DRAFT_871406 [Pholiota conissans]|uniref:DUF4203 domain-containing protein n=1 Tax=Pholiota conissans TaxID=109636 RepID=A0A9P5ZDX8_9AGAR|nr:hypothetical protein BDN70DRAFT_871406 [Pholiota conissans]